VQACLFGSSLSEAAIVSRCRHAQHLLPAAGLYSEALTDGQVAAIYAAVNDVALTPADQARKCSSAHALSSCRYSPGATLRMTTTRSACFNRVESISATVMLRLPTAYR